MVKYLLEQFDLGAVELVGASAGALKAVLAACGVAPDRAAREAYRLSVEQGIWTRPQGLAGIWGTLVRRWLDELLPANAAELCNGRVKIVATQVPSLRLCYLDSFETREDVIDALSEPWLAPGL